MFQDPQQHTKDWSARISAADAVVFVTSEYNYGYPAALKSTAARRRITP